MQSQINNKSDKAYTYLETYVDVFLYMWQAAIDRRVLINAVYVNGKTDINAVSNDLLKDPRVDGSLVYDAFELSYNNGNKTILQLNNVDIVQPLTNSVAVNDYNKSEIDIGLNLKSDKIDT